MKRLVFLFDGTGQFAARPRADRPFSNIHQLNTLIASSDPGGHAQIVHYVRGVGDSRPLCGRIAALFGRGIGDDVRSAYLSLCSNYEEGDEIYLFGYSRGAIAARVLSGLLRQGVIDPVSAHVIDDIWACYEDEVAARTKKGLPCRGTDTTVRTERAARLATRMVGSPDITFMGLFDATLGGFDWLRRRQEINGVNGIYNQRAKAIVHLCAMDEERRILTPRMFDRIENSRDFRRHLEQIWLPGCHGDIGGTGENAALCDLALLVMVDRLMTFSPIALDSQSFEALVDRCAQHLRPPIRLTPQAGGLLWKVAGLPRHPRGPRGAENTRHPACMKLRDMNVQYRRSLRPYEVPPTFAALSDSAAFLSRELKGFPLWMGGGREAQSTPYKGHAPSVVPEPSPAGPGQGSARHRSTDERQELPAPRF